MTCTLHQAGIARARALVVTTPDLVSAPAAIRHARKLNPEIAIIVRAAASGDVSMLRAAGANEIIQQEFEAGMESVRYILREFRVSARESSVILGRRRALHYQGESESPLLEESTPQFGPDISRLDSNK